MRHKFLLLLLFSLSLCSVLIFFTIYYTIFDVNNYLTDFNNNRVYDTYPDAKLRLNNILNFFSGKADLVISYFNERETLHLNDIKLLVNKLSNYLFISILILALSFITISSDLRLLGTGLITTSVFIILTFIILSKISFDKIFLWFHLTFFNNDYWLLSVNDSLITLFQLNFFQTTFNRISVNLITMAIIIFVVGIIVKHNGLRA